jgi:hypothetical protein
MERLKQTTAAAPARHHRSTPERSRNPLQGSHPRNKPMNCRRAMRLKETKPRGG